MTARKAVLLVTVVPGGAVTALPAPVESSVMPDESMDEADSYGTAPDLFSSCSAANVPVTVPWSGISGLFPCTPFGALPGVLHPQSTSNRQRNQNTTKR